MRILLILFTVLFISGCDTQNDKIIKIKGETMGTYYHVSFVGDNSSNSTALKERIDQRLIAINKSMSTYDPQDRKSTRLNSSHVRISYAVFCLKKKRPL